MEVNQQVKKHVAYLPAPCISLISQYLGAESMRAQFAKVVSMLYSETRQSEQTEYESDNESSRDGYIWRRSLLRYRNGYMFAYHRIHDRHFIEEVDANPQLSIPPHTWHTLQVFATSTMLDN